MDFTLSAEQTLLTDSAARFLSERYGLGHYRATTERGGFDPESWARFAEMGWLSLPFIEDEAGGLDSLEDVMLLLIAFGRALVIEPYVTSLLLGGRILSRTRGGEDSLLSGLAEGNVRVALAHDETNVPSHANAEIAVTADTADGGYRIKGRKRAVQDAPHATHLIVTARLKGKLALLLVPADAPGMVRQDYRQLDGTRAADIAFEQVSLPADALLVSGDDARALLSEALDHARLGCLAQSIGSTERVLELCSDYLKVREQFGRKIGSFQALRHIMAGMFVEAQEARSILYMAAASMRGDPAARGRALDQASVVIGEAADHIAKAGIQLHGGYGMTDEFAVSHHFKRLLVLGKIFGEGQDALVRLAELA
ncbi:MAG: acyl-CoA dehydrogenase [Pseudomonadota bacterium]